MGTPPDNSDRDPDLSGPPGISSGIPSSLSADSSSDALRGGSLADRVDALLALDDEEVLDADDADDARSALVDDDAVVTPSGLVRADRAAAATVSEAPYSAESMDIELDAAIEAEVARVDPLVVERSAPSEAAKSAEVSAVDEVEVAAELEAEPLALAVASGELDAAPVAAPVADPVDSAAVVEPKNAEISEEISEISEISEIAEVAQAPAPPIRPGVPPPPPRLPPRPVRPVATVTVPPRPPSAAPPVPPPARSGGDPLDALEAKLSALEDRAEDGDSERVEIAVTEPTPARAPLPRPPSASDSLELGGEGLPAPELAPAASGPLPVMAPPLESLLENPTAIDRAGDELTDAGAERRAEDLAQKIEDSDDAGAALLAYELGELYERRLADEARAVKAYGRALLLDSSYRPNLWAIRRVFYRRKLWPNLLKLIDAELRYVRSEEERADLLLEKARILAHQVGNYAGARQAAEEAVVVAPNQQVALLELERLVARENDPVALKEVWERLADAAVHPARKVATWLDVARACDRQELPRALAALDAAAAVAATAADGAGDDIELERVARERVRLCEAAGVSAEQVSAIDKLVTVLLRGFGPAGAPPASADVDRREVPDRATALRRQIVALRRQQAQLLRREAPQRSWDLLQDAMALAPGEPILLGDLTDLAEELGRFEDLAELVASWQSIEGDPSRGLVLSIRRADALTRGGRRDEAKALLASLEATAPGFIVLTAAAERDALIERDASALAQALARAASAAQLGTWMGAGVVPPDLDAAVALYVGAAEIFAYVVGGEQGAADAKAALGKALELRPSSAAAIEASIELADHLGDVAGALALIDRRLGDTLDLEARRSLLERATRIAKSHGDLETALATDRKLLELSPGDRSLKWRVEAMLGQLGREAERAELLGTLATEESDPTRRVMALVAAARLRERLGQIDVATDLYRQSLGIWPDDVFARESLADLLRAQERWTELVDERRSEARLLPDGPSARRALREAAWVLEHRIGDIPTALAVYIDWSERLLDDRTALEGVARCYARLGDSKNEVAVRGRLADLEGSPVVVWEWARALERADRLDEAIDAYRAVIDAENAQPEARTGVAGPLAALTLGELAVQRNDALLEVEAIAALAARTTSNELGAALAEEAGWRYALLLDDPDRAGQSFAAALATDPNRKGALLGSGLVAAKRGDVIAQGSAFESLASAVSMPEASGALYLRASAMAAAQGDRALMQRRVKAAWSAAHEDVSSLVVAAETWELPDGAVVGDGAGASGAGGAGGSDNAPLIDALLARAEILERRAALTDDPVARSSWELDLAEVLERAGRLREAGDVVASVLRALPDDLRALSALRRLTKRGGQRKLWADASYRLSRQLLSASARLALLRDAVSVYDGSESGTPPASLPHALAAYRRMFELDPGMPELARYLELIRQSGDVPGLLAVLTARLAWLDQVDGPSRAGVPVLLERATVRFGSEDQLGAIADLDELLAREPAHLEALRFRADLALATGDAPGAAERWRRCLDLEKRPERRADIELALAKVLAEEMSDVDGAIEQLSHVVAQQPADLGLRERLLGLHVRAGGWEAAARELRELARLRVAPEDKARDEHRLAAMLRDKLGDRLGARLALDRGRNLDPLNLDCIRELADLLEQPARQQMLGSAADKLRELLAATPHKPLLYDRLAAVLSWQSDVDGRWLALVALEAVGTPSAEQRQVLTSGRSRARAPGTAAKRIDSQAWGHLTPPIPSPQVGELWRAMAPAVTASIGLDAGKLGFGRGDRLAMKKLADRDRQLATACATFGLADADLYVAEGHDARAMVARVLSGEPPTVCLGRDIAGAANPAARYALGRALALAVNGYGTLAEIREGELERFAVAALRAAEAPVPAALQEFTVGEDAAMNERARLMRKHLSRKDRAAIAQLATRGDSLVDFAGFRRAALGCAHRAGLLWSGDLAVALAALDAGKGGRSLADNPAAVDLLVWSVSLPHAHLRDELGLSLAGNP